MHITLSLVGWGGVVVVVGGALHGSYTAFFTLTISLPASDAFPYIHTNRIAGQKRNLQTSRQRRRQLTVALGPQQQQQEHRRRRRWRQACGSGAQQGAG